MNPSKIFILRPVATTLLMVAILLVGAVAYMQLPLSALPEVAYPTIQVQTFYPGASPEVITSAITAPLEKQFGQMPGLNQMSSTSSAGASVITLQFNLALAIDVAEQEVQAAISGAQNLHAAGPAGTADLRQGQSRRRAGAHARHDLQGHAADQVEDLADTRIAQKISQLKGVGVVSISGGQRPAVRVVVEPAGPRRLRTESSTTCARPSTSPTRTAPRARFDGPTRSYTINANDQLKSAEDYGDIVIAYRNGAPVRLSDVAQLVSERRERQARRLDEHDAGADHQCAAPARRQRRRRGRQHQELLPSLRAVAAGRRRRAACSPTAPRPSAPRSPTSSSSWRSPWRWSCW